MKKWAVLSLTTIRSKYLKHFVLYDCILNNFGDDLNQSISFQAKKMTNQ